MKIFRKHFPISLIDARLIIPESFEDCLTYGQRQEYMWKKIKELENKVKDLEKSDEDLTNN